MPISWLPSLILVEDFDHDWKRYDVAVYEKFCVDLISQNPNFQLKRFSLNKTVKIDGRESVFWHLVTEGKIEKDRTIDPRRCERIGWVKPLVEEYPNTRLNIWGNVRTRSGSGGVEKRILLSPVDFSYVVVLADKNSYALLITAYYLEQQNRRDKLKAEFEAWKKAGTAL